MTKYFKDIWVGLYTVLIGMRITMLHLFKQNVTVQYPNVHPSLKAGHDKMPSNSRNRLFLDIDLCNGCNGCVRACPVNCIEVETIKVVPGDEAPPLKDGSKRNLWVSNYEIDMAKCCFCALCTEVCATEAVMMTTEFEYSTRDRKDLKYKFSIMQKDQIIEKQQLFEVFQAEKKKEAAAAKAAKAKVAAAKETNNEE